MGGLLGGDNWHVAAEDVYWDTTVGPSSGVGDRSSRSPNLVVTGKTTTELQSPTGYTGIYANWNLDLDGRLGVGDAQGRDDPWDFGTATNIPSWTMWRWAICCSPRSTTTATMTG